MQWSTVEPSGMSTPDELRATGEDVGAAGGESDRGEAAPVAVVDTVERVAERTRGALLDHCGNLVSLTRAGETAFRPAGRIHIEGIDRHVGAHLDTHEMAELRRLLTKLVDSDPADS